MKRCDYSAPLPAGGWCALWGCKSAGQVQQPFEVMVIIIIMVIVVITIMMRVMMIIVVMTIMMRVMMIIIVKLLIIHSQVIGHWECLSWC